MALWQIFYAFSILFNLVVAIPTITYPFNSQVPPIARLSKPFSYTFSSSTFFSNLPLSYLLSSSPSWLSLDNQTRTLSGTPSAQDVGGNTVTGVTIELTAIDSSGSTTLTATLVVSKDPGPVVSLEPAAQFSSFNAFSAPSTLLYHPSTPFKVTFDPKTFIDNGGSSGMVYYAVSADNTPLPSWILFDETTLSFSGQTPDYETLIQPPQTFGVQLIASDVEGFGGASLFLNIEVGVHLFAFKNTQIVINATAGGDINFVSILGLLQLDNTPATRNNIASISGELPPWLTLDNSTLVLSGTVPTDASSLNFTLQIVDIYGDISNALVSIEILTEIFSTSIDTLNATAGSSFAYDMSTYLRNKSNVSMTAQFSPPTTWISFDSQSFILKGEVPPTATASSIVVSLVATSKSLHTSESRSLHLSIAPGTLTASSTPKSPTSKPSSSPSSTTTGLTAPSTSSFSQTDLSKNTLLAIFIPLAIFLFIILILLCHCLRRRLAAKSKNYTDNVNKLDISAPLEATSSVVETIGVNPKTVYTQAPGPLKLDMSGFSDPKEIETALELELKTNDEKARSGVRYTYTANQAMRHSQTTSATSYAWQSRLRDSYLSGNRARARSDHALSSTEKSSRTHERDSTALTVSTTTNSVGTTRLMRNYSNYSRKGHSRRSVMMPAINVAGPAQPSQGQAQSTILKLREDGFSKIPLDNYSVIQKPPGTGTAKSKLKQNIERPESSAMARRHSRFKPVLIGRAPSGIGHGRRESILSKSRKHLSIGHGQETHGLTRDSGTWVTVGVSAVNSNKHRYSNASVLSDYGDIRTGTAEVAPLKTVRNVSKSKSPDIELAGTIRSVSSEYSRHSRPVSRAIQSSPFFAGSSFRMSRQYSRRSPKKMRKSYADSPTVPEGSTRFPNRSLEATVLQGLREESQIHEDEERGRGRGRDSFRITYGMAQEGTRQLRSYIQNQITRARSKKSNRTMSSHKSTKSIDSRFESALGSMDEIRQQQQEKEFVKRERSPRRERRRPRSELNFDDWHADPSVEGSEVSWETQHGENSSENVIRYYTEMDENFQLPLQPPNPGFSRQLSQSVPSSPIMGKEMGMLDDGSPKPRVVKGAGRRPISVDAKASKRGMRASRSQRGELDYTAYI